MKLQCVECGDFCVSKRSHELFCKGVEKGKPWLMMPITKENVRVWSGSKSFKSWAKALGVNLSNFEEN